MLQIAGVLDACISTEDVGTTSFRLSATQIGFTAVAMSVAFSGFRPGLEGGLLLISIAAAATTVGAAKLVPARRPGSKKTSRRMRRFWTPALFWPVRL